MSDIGYSAVRRGSAINLQQLFFSKITLTCFLSVQFARLYPLDQKDMAPALRPIDFSIPIPAKVEVETSARDYTPPQYLTLLFTDLGVLTPSVVSDELIQLYL